MNEKIKHDTSCENGVRTQAVFFAFVLLCAAIPALLGTVSADTGGPDIFGYNWIDSKGPAPMVGFSWVEINSTGVDSGVIGDDSFGGPFALGFTFDFYGNSYTDLYFNTNGLITFGSGSNSPSNTPIPSASLPHDFIAAFWDDLAVGPGYNSGSIYYEQMGIAPNRQFVVEWCNITTLGGAGPMSFEVILNETGQMWIQFDKLGSANSGGATVGIENFDGTDGLEYCFDTPGIITNNLAVMFSRPSYAVSVSPGAQSDLGDLGAIIPYNLTVMNTGTNDDTYDLTASGNSWTTEIYDATGTVLISSISVPSGSSDDITVKVTIPGVANPGDFDEVTITATSQNDSLVDASVTLNTTYLKIPTYVAVFRDADPWGFSSVQDILTAWSIPFDLYASSDIGVVNLAPYDKVIIPSDQPQAFYDAVELNLAWFDGYVTGGGILQFGAGSNGWNGGSWNNVPGGYTKVYNTDNTVTIDIPTHPFITVPNTITDPELDGWSSSTHAYFGGLPPFSVTVATDSNGPCIVESVSGLGRYFAYGLIAEWGWGQGYSAILENIILCMEGQATMPAYAFDLTPGYQTGYNNPGFPADYIFTVTNTGTSDDTYDLSDVSIWPVVFRDIGDTMDITTIFVASGTSEDFIARVTIPGGALPGDVDVADIMATSQGDPAINRSSLTSTQVPYPVGWFDGFESGFTGWEIGLISISNPTPTSWESGDPLGAGPGSAYNGSVCAGTNLLDDYYLSADITLTTPYVELGAAPMMLSFYNWFEMDTNGDDGGFIEISANNGPWNQIWPIGGYPWVGGIMGGYNTDGYSGLTPAWEYEEFDLSAFASQVVRVRFHFASSDWWGWQWGWYVDDIYIGSPPPYELDLLPVNQDFFGSPGTSVDYIMTIDNTGTSDDTYDLSVSGNLWPMVFRDIGDALDITSIFVSSGTSDSFIARVSIPGGASPGDLDSATVTATSQGDPLVFDDASLRIQVPHTVSWFDGFESGWGAWNTWEFAPSNPTPTNWEMGDNLGMGPAAPYNGGNLSGTNVVDWYYPSADTTLITPYVQLGAAPQIFSFFTWYNMNTGGDDGGFVEISVNGGPWNQIWPMGGYPWVGGMIGNYWVDGYSGDSTGWEYEEFDLGAYAGSVVQARFHFATSDWWGWQWGWYVDDVYMGVPPPFRFDLAPVLNNSYGGAGTNVDYVLSIDNTGSSNDIYDLTSTGSWPVVFRDIGDTMDITTLSVNSGATGSFIARVSVPGGATPGDSDIANVTATSQGDPLIWSDGTLNTFVPFTAPWFDDLESGMGLWSMWDDGGGTLWEMGDPAGGVGPTNAFTPVTCWGTNMLTDYALPSESILTTPPVDLGAVPSPKLTFQHWYYIDGPPISGDVEDGGAVEISTDGGLSWNYITPVGGYPEQAEVGYPWALPNCYAGDSGGWIPAEFDLSAYSGQVVKLRFYFWTEPWAEAGYAGWYIDDVFIGPPSPYDFELLPTTDSSWGPSGSSVDYVMTINNIGSIDDTYDLSDVSIWSVVFRDIGDTMDITSIFVAQGTSEDFIARVTIPGGANPGDSDVADVTVTSQGDASKWHTSTISSGVPFPAPWFDDFEFGIFGGSTGVNWTKTSLNFADVGVQTSQSGTYSLYTCGGIVNVTSLSVDLSILASAEVRLWIQRGDDIFSEDPDAGEDLIIEYRNDVGTWILLDTYLGSGTAGEIYTPIYTLPADALHIQFQLRLRQTGGSGAGMDFWHIDDVYIGAPLGDITPPADIVDLAVSVVTDNTATLTWTAPGDDGMSGTAAGYEVRYSTIGTITPGNWGTATLFAQSWTPQPGGNAESHDVTSLVSGTQYWFAIITRDEVPNWSGVSNSPTGTTTVSDVTPPADITDLGILSTTSSTATLTWTAPGDDGMAGTAAGYEVRFSTVGIITPGNWGTATVFAQSWMPQTGGNAESHDVTGLASGTQYWFAIIASDEVPNWSGVSNSPTGTTLIPSDVTPPADITDLVVWGTTFDTVTLTWTSPGDDGMAGTATGYEIRYSTAGPITDANWGTATVFPQAWTPLPGGNVEMYDVTGLSPSTQYWFAVRAVDEEPNWSGTSNSPSVTTDPLDATPPDIISDLAVFAISANDATLTWTAPGDDGAVGSATSYEVRYSTTGPITDANWASATMHTQSWTPQIAGNTETHIITGLTSGTQYWFAVRTADEVPNWAGASNSPTGTTLTDNMPPSISNIRVNGQNSIAVRAGADVILTANINDESTGNSHIAGANYTRGTQNWPGTTMTPSDSFFDTSSETVTHTIETAGWNDGTYRIYVYAWDAIPNHNSDSTAYATITIDSSMPVSSIDAITTYWHTSSPLTITATASDSGTGLASVRAFYRFSSDNSNWGSWVSMGDDLTSPWEWSFDFPSGDGHFQFRSRAMDIVGNTETGTSEDATCGYDSTEPESTIGTIAPFWQVTSPRTLTASVSDATSGKATCELFYRFSPDNTLWGSWISYGLDHQNPWNWDFDYSDGEGYYQFYTKATDIAGNEETGTTGETSCGYDVTPPVADAGSRHDVMEGATVAFDGTGSSDNIGIHSHEWTFTDVDPQTLSGESPSYTFNNHGNFLVTLTVTDHAGHSSSSSIWVSVDTITDPTTGIISGFVKDNDGNPLAGAVVSIPDTPYAAVTDETGHYTMTHVPPGNYDLAFRKDGFESGTITDVGVSSGQETTNPDFILPKGAEDPKPIPVDYWWLILLMAMILTFLFVVVIAKRRKREHDDGGEYQPDEYDIETPGPVPNIPDGQPYMAPPAMADYMDSPPPPPPDDFGGFEASDPDE